MGDEYCASPKKMKDIVTKRFFRSILFPKFLFFFKLVNIPQAYGWNMKKVGAIRTTIEFLHMADLFTLTTKHMVRKFTFIRRIGAIGGSLETLAENWSSGYQKPSPPVTVATGNVWWRLPSEQWVPKSQGAQGSTKGNVQMSTDPKELLGIKEGEWLKNGGEGMIVQAVHWVSVSRPLTRRVPLDLFM